MMRSICTLRIKAFRLPSYCMLRRDPTSLAMHVLWGLQLTAIGRDPSTVGPVATKRQSDHLEVRGKPYPLKRPNLCDGTVLNPRE